MTSAIVVAAGLSKRMGNVNKLLLPFQGKALFLHIIDELLELRLNEIIIVVGHEYDSVIAALNNREVKIIYNEEYEKGLTSSIQAGVLFSNSEVDNYLICLSDMPFVKKKHIMELLNHHHFKNQITIPKIKEKRSHPILFSATFKDEILNHKDMDGCKRIIQKNMDKVKFISFEEDFSWDIDDPETYHELA